MDQWIELFNKNELEPSHFREYWKTNVPASLSPKPKSQPLNIPVDEGAIKNNLLVPLETFLFGRPWLQASEELRSAEKPSVRCGKVFKVGEPTYSCRDCGADPTCVLCVDCFKTSGHQSHRYRMSTSGGGGYCDCGDTEAWRSGAFCNTHQETNASSDDVNSVLSRVSPTLITKGRIVMEAVVAYCHEMILWDSSLKLPLDLAQTKEGSTSDSYVTLLYNDEIHTYDQVIRALVRNITCTQKVAVDLATLVDREGRAVIKCDSNRECNVVKEMVEKFTAHHIPKPLRVIVMHADVLAHQNFSLKLLTWLLQIINQSRCFRYLFSEVVFRESETTGKRSIVENLMGYDTKMWKSARSLWHQLFISGLLMETDSKQKFSRLYARNYPSIVRDFVEDDHEQTLSITSLSVQLFTVPSLAHMLIAEENIIFILLHTFNTESEGKLNSDGKLAFVRTSPDIQFKRACYVLNDLYYLVNTPPEQWTGALRRNFLHGFTMLLELLSRIHGMDAAIRQVGQHVEFEPEWETAFSLHLRLGGTVSMMIQWCCTDRMVLIKAYRAVTKKLAYALGKLSYIVHKVADHTVSCIAYDVSAEPVSIHLPLCGILSGLHVHLERHDLQYDSPELAWNDKLSPAAVMELPLRTQVMMAQVHAGMWRRNGYSLLNQIFFYRNVRYRTEIYDRDIVALQIGASLMDANDFLIHFLNKFGLLQWVWEDYSMSDCQLFSSDDDSVALGSQESRALGAKGRQTSSIAEDFLSLVIIVVGERFLKGVGQVTAEDCVKKEVIQQLSIEPMSHSQLVKALPEDPNHETGLEKVIDQVAMFKKPSGSSKGVYELLPEAHKHFNPFYFHYSREEQSKAEEFQRKRARDPAVEGSIDDSSCLPPPIPPLFSKPFSSIVNILCCDVMLKIMRLLVERTSQAYTSNGVPPTDAEIQRILHLIGYALHEEQRSLEAGNLFFQFTKRASKENILDLLESLLAPPISTGSKNGFQVPHRDLISWTVKKFKHVKRNHASLAEESGIGDGVKNSESISTDEVEPMEVQTEKNDEKQRRAELAMARRARIMAQMADMQKSFISAHANLFEGTNLSLTSGTGSAMDLTEAEEVPSSAVCLGRDMGTRSYPRIVHTCILCQEEERVSIEGRPLVFSVLVQKSTVLSSFKGGSESHEMPSMPLLPPSHLRCALHVSTCGHVMHAECWRKYFELVASKERRRSIRIRQNVSFDVNKQEFLCPLCECLSNAVIPIIPSSNHLSNPTQMELSLNGWIQLMEQLLNCLQRKEPIKGIKEWPVEILHIMNDIRVSSQDEINVPASVMEMVNVFAKATFMVGLGSSPGEEDARIVPIALYACFYTIRVIEMSLRDSGKPTFGEFGSRQSDAMNALIGFASVCGRLTSTSKLEIHLKTILSFLLSDQSSDDNCILKIDAFGLLLSLVIVKSHLLGQTGFVIETATLRIVFVLHCLQIICTAKIEANESVDPEENNPFAEIYKKLYPENTQINNKFLQKEIEQRSIPFLRCCALLFHNLTGISPPEDLCQLQDNEYTSLCHYLALEPDASVYIQHSSGLRTIVERWINHASIAKFISESRAGPTVDINQLCELPLDYSELINEAACFTCPNSEGEGSRVPTLCLICGQILCSQSYCCQSELNGHSVGACTYHANRCGAGVGMFLRIRECKVLLLASRTKGCFISPPYLDRYGETDQGLRRGNPLFLCRDGYKKLHRMWLNHGIMEEIAHSLESVHYVSAVEWQHL